MKKIIFIIFSTTLLVGLMACSNPKSQSSNNVENFVNNKKQGDNVAQNGDVRETVWLQLSLEQKEWIDGTWKDGKVSKITLKKNMMGQVGDKSYAGKEVYLIDFPTKSKYIPNNIIVYADIKTFDYIGDGLVD